MAKTHERVFALVAALLFLGTSIAVTVAVVLQASQQNKAEKASQDLTESSIKQPTKEGQLQGTKLNDFTVTDKIEKLQSVDIQTGTGEEVKPGDTITAHYTGAVAGTGIIFQSSLDMGEPVSFSLAQVIKGWTDGVPGMKVGGKRRLLIPAEQAYGANPPGGSGIPANADLVFDIELFKIGE